jgi:hypothetical protein
VKKRFLPFVEVTWADSCSSNAWKSHDEALEWHGPVECSTVGYLFKRDKVGVTLAMSISKTGGVGGLWHVPNGMVKRVRRLRAKT